MMTTGVPHTPRDRDPQGPRARSMLRAQLGTLASSRESAASAKKQRGWPPNHNSPCGLARSLRTRSRCVLRAHVEAQRTSMSGFLRSKVFSTEREVVRGRGGL